MIKVNPNSMVVNGVVGNRHLSSPTPRFAWTIPPGGTQTNWQIQVDSDPNFNGHQGEIWFWDSGTGSKNGMEGDSNVPYSAVNAPGKPSRPVDSRADLIYWRLRIQINNDPNWDNDPNYFSYGSFHPNQLPGPPEDIVVAVDPVSGSIPGFVYPPAAPSPREYFVAPNGNDSNPGSLASPFKTINRGVQAVDFGDTLTLRGGVYNENVRITQSAGVNPGFAGVPITLRARPGEQVTIRGVGVGTQPFAPISIVGTSGPMRHWIVDGVRLGGGSSQVGVYVSAGEFITLKNLSFESSTFNPSGTGVKIEGGGVGNRVLRSKFDMRAFDQVEVAGSKYVEIRENEFTGGNNHSAIHWHNSGSVGGIISDNVFHDMVVNEGAMFVYLSGDQMTIRNNIIHDVTESPGGYTAGVVILRCGKILVENNTFVRTKRGIGVNEFSRFNVIRNNIFFENGQAIDFRAAQSAQQGSSALGTLVSNNIFYRNSEDIDLFYPADDTMITKLSNCMGGPPPSNPACNPQFVDSAADNFKLQSASPARNAGDPATPVPAGGGSIVDIGAAEFAATGTGLPPYDYQTIFTIGDVTPRFLWSIVDRDNDLCAFDPNIVPDPDSQTGFELQVDTLPTFDSVKGSRPLFSSGTVPSTVCGYTLPDLNALAAGQYFVRIRTRDENTGVMGGWSNNNVRFRVSSEPQAPILTQHNPPDGSFGVDPNAVYSVHVVDFGVGVNAATIVVNTGINDPGTPDAVTPSITPVGTSGTEYVVSFRPAGTIGSGDRIHVRVRAADLYVPPIQMDLNWSFTTRDTVPPQSPTNNRVVP